MSKSSRRKKRPNRSAVVQSSPPAELAVAPIAQNHSLRPGYAGPIPPPAMLKEFNEIIPDGANRILKMAEVQVAHRHSLEAACCQL